MDFSLKKCLHKSAEGKETNVVLQLWDIAGHERFGHLTHVYYKGAIASIVVFDLGRPATFESVLKVSGWGWGGEGRGRGRGAERVVGEENSTDGFCGPATVACAVAAGPALQGDAARRAADSVHFAGQQGLGGEGRDRLGE